jgi:hypothetical protein
MPGTQLGGFKVECGLTIKEALATRVPCLQDSLEWPAPGSEDTELGVLMELEVGHGETEVYPRVQA